MRWLGPVFSTLVAGALSQVSCGTSAVGIDDCRSIERARCAAARGCDLEIDTTSDEAVCERFARDNCLHGLPVQAPTAGSVTNCVNMINAAGACAAKKTSLGDCTAVKDEVSRSNATVCEIIENPEQITACEFLTESPKPAPTSTPPKDSGNG
jgi:hypothetical protein